MTAASHPVELDTEPAPSTTTAPPRMGRIDAAKRAMDIVISLALLLALAPLFPVVALAIFVESPGPVLFRQRRLGRHGEEFGLLKFRSMRPDAEQLLADDADLRGRFVANGFKLGPRDDPRVTRVGRILRRFSLDELPQLLNVLAGHMSLVGPRPPIIEQVPLLYGEDVHHYFSVRPGLTGPWQVCGRSALSDEQRRRFDVHYAQSRTIRGDLLLLVRTIPAVLSGRGAC